MRVPKKRKGLWSLALTLTLTRGPSFAAPAPNPLKARELRQLLLSPEVPLKGGRPPSDYDADGNGRVDMEDFALWDGRSG